MKEQNGKVCGFWLVFRAPDSLLAFFSGAFISVGLGFLTQGTIDLYKTFSAILMIVVSFLLVVWTICAKSLEESYVAAKEIIAQMSQTDSKYPLRFWRDLLNNHKKSKNLLLTVFILIAVFTVASIVLLVIPHLLPV